MDIKVREYLGAVRDECIGCGICTAFQQEEGQVPLAFGEIAGRLLEADEAAAAEGRSLKGLDLPEDIYDFARSCLMCGRCTSRCPVDIRAPKAVAAARSVIAQAMPRIVDDYRRYRCDRADSMFSRIRTVQHEAGNAVPVEPSSAFNDATVGAGDALCGAALDGKRSLFFPGCSLNNNFPAFASHVYRRLEDDGIVDCMTQLCCGRPLFLAGLPDERDAYEDELCARIARSGVERVIVCCPNCFYTMRESFERCGIAGSVELRYLTEVLADEGYRYEPSEAFPYGKVAIHDSCPDRHDGIIAQSLRTLFENVEVVEPANSQTDSICCGAGGFASVYKGGLCQALFAKGVAEFYETRARCLVTSCATCAATYKSSGAVQCCHVLELVFDQPMDMDAYDATFETLWNPDDPRFLGTFDSDEPFFAQG